MSDTFITLTTYTYSTESYILVAKLEAAGIKAFVKNDNLVSTQHFLSNAVGGVDVQVRKADFENALQILKELQKIDQSSKEVPGDLKNNYEKVLVYCPECESTNVYRKKVGLFSFGAKEHICVDCQAKWKQ